MVWGLFYTYIKWTLFSWDCSLIVSLLHVLCELSFIWELPHMSFV